MSSANVDETIRDIWRTRPRRALDGRKVAGVAAGIAERYGIDPLIVRVAFVVTTVYGGAGALLYALGWLLLPDGDDDVSGVEALAGRGNSRMSGGLVVALAIGVVTLGWMAVDGIDGLVAIGLVAVAVVLLHRERANRGVVPAPVRYSSTTGDATTTVAGDDPLGAAPTSWELTSSPPGPDLPGSHTPRPESPRGRVLTPVTVVLAAIAAVVGAVVVPSATIGQLAAVALGVVGVGLLVAAVTHRGRGLVGWAVVLTVIATLLHSTPPSSVAVGDRLWRPATTADVDERYDLTLGDAELDLSRLDLDDATVRTAVSLPIGSTTVRVPRDADVTVRCSVRVGQTDCLGVTSSGPLRDPIERTDNGPDGPGGGAIVLDVSGVVGEIAVIR